MVGARRSGLIRSLAVILVFTGATGIALFLNACATFSLPVVTAPKIEGATFVGNRACLDCHTNHVRGFDFNPHSRVQVTGTDKRQETGCEACHGPGSKHIAAGGGRGKFIVNPGRQPDACFQCHIETHAEFNLPQHHPVIEGRMNCVECHDPHGGDMMKRAGGLAMARLNESCAECHREQTRPFVFEHEAMREGCTTCHNPHGSPNSKMLVQPDSNLCLRCHAQVQGSGVPSGDFFIGKIPHSGAMASGSCWAAGCHTAVHGSNIQPRLLY